MIHGSRGDLKKKTGKVYDLAKKLREYNIEVRWHIYSGARLPAVECDLILMVTDIGDHDNAQNQQALADQAGVTVVRITHRWADTQKVLEAAGFKRVPRGNKPVQPEKPSRCMPEPAIRTPLVKQVLKQPWLRNDELESLARTLCRDHSVAFRMTMMHQTLAAIRLESGIVARGKGRRIHRPTYDAACAVNHVIPDEWPGKIPLEWLDQQTWDFVRASSGPGTGRGNASSAKPKLKPEPEAPKKIDRTPDDIERAKTVSPPAPKSDPDSKKTLKQRIEDLVLGMMGENVCALEVVITEDCEIKVELIRRVVTQERFTL
tara:strand:- start:106 stop:1059 length:954 start_codon:yes stop_codon:yes gene_type:complete